MASIIELQKRIDLLKSFSRVVNIQKIVVMKKIAELKTRMKALGNSYELLYKTISDIRITQPSLFDSKLFVSSEEAQENREKEVEFKLLETLTNDKKTKYKKAIFLMSTKPVDKLSNYSIKRMAEMAKKAYNDDIIYIVLGEDLRAQMDHLEVPIYSFIGDDVAFGKTNEVFKIIAELTLSLYESMTATNISFVFDNIEKAKDLRQVPLLPFTETLGKESIDFTALVGTKDKTLSSILEEINVKTTSFERGLEFTGDFLMKMQIQNVVELAHLSYIFAASNRELHNLDDKKKNVESEQVVTKLKMQRIRKESITNELISTSGAFMSINTQEEEDDD